MSFDHRDIRRDMDVYTLDNAYLGTVLSVLPGLATGQPGQVAPAARQASSINGELLGPMPTEPAGNQGPTNQSARTAYAIQADGRPLGRGAMIRVGKWWGLAGQRMIPLDAVQAVSLERVVLALKKEELGG